MLYSYLKFPELWITIAECLLEQQSVCIKKSFLLTCSRSVRCTDTIELFAVDYLNTWILNTWILNSIFLNIFPSEYFAKNSLSNTLEKIKMFYSLSNMFLFANFIFMYMLHRTFSSSCLLLLLLFIGRFHWYIYGMFHYYSKIIWF